MNENKDVDTRVEPAAPASSGSLTADGVLGVVTAAKRTDHWSVAVDRNGENLVTIESRCLSGKPEFSDEEARLIRGAARCLLAFIGPGQGDV